MTTQDAASIDTLLNELLSSMTSNSLQSILLEGRLFWIGIHPAYKGKGLGRGLHTIGLYRLQHDFQAKSYLGATEIENAPMRKIMETNGCVQQATVVSLKYSIALL
ncbi:hypothetical protein [Paenibacillus alvei]|uniref:hypothetical protein n=1 Tax=Paenibacillus alvei TaxID=44250 RepID=UPI002280CC7A|nr:hypothetical protein [Paenibacillus alvei]